MRRAFTCAFLLGISGMAVFAAAQPISITAFNIENYGNGFNTSKNSLDSRNQAVRDFLELTAADADVISFEEILNINELKVNLLQNRYDCHSYDENNGGHQHVVICHKKEFTFRISADDDNYIWENVSMGRLRPAVHGILVNAKGRDLAHIIALHLKAMPDQTALRLEQTQMIAEHINDRNDQLPVILLGDLNTYNDDIDQMLNALNKSVDTFRIIENPFAFTYRTSRYSNKFDWIVVSGQAPVIRDLQVSGPCNIDWHSGTAFDDLSYYNTKVSDHCPVNVQLDL